MKTIDIPWGAWYNDSFLSITFPDEWNVHNCHIKGAASLSINAIESSLQNSINSAPLNEIAKGKEKIVIAVEDITRPSKVENVLQAILKQLRFAGIINDQISIIFCNGAHYPHLRHDIELKLGASIANQFLVLNHNPYNNLVDTGIPLGKNTVKINRFYAEADLKIAIGSIIPHSFAGYSAGGKLILPGMSDIITLERSHKFVLMGFRGGVDDVENNKFRLELEDVVSKVGLDFFVGIVPNARREVAGVFAGNFVQAHRKGVEMAREIFKTQIPLHSDVIVMNAYPKDSELLQADTAFVPLKTIKDEVIKEDGIFIVTSKCTNGFGYHCLFAPGMPLYKKPMPKSFLRKRKLIFFSKNINDAEFYSLYWDGYQLIKNWDSVIAILNERFKDKCTVTVLPYAPLQLLRPL